VTHFSLAFIGYRYHAVAIIRRGQSLQVLLRRVERPSDL
jgi:hypothetical protein